MQFVGNAKAPTLKGLTSAKDTFDFKLFTLSSKHVQMINAIFLENAPGSLNIIFRERTALRRGLEVYLELERPGWKTTRIINSSDFHINAGFPAWHDYKQYLNGLEKVVRGLGSEVHAKYNINVPNAATVVGLFSPKFEKRYRKLGKHFILTCCVY